MGFHLHGAYGASLNGTIDQYAEHHKDSRPSVCKSCESDSTITHGALYELEKKLGRKPTRLEAGEISINTSQIPEGCPKLSAERR